jgi:hypothetical protein
MGTEWPPCQYKTTQKLTGSYYLILNGIYGVLINFSVVGTASRRHSRTRRLCLTLVHTIIPPSSPSLICTYLEIIAILQSKFSDPPEQPNAPRRYESKKSRNIAIGREFITDEDDNFDDFTDPNGTHDLFSQTADGSPIDPDLVRAAQEQLEAVLEIASQQAAASGSRTREA